MKGRWWSAADADRLIELRDVEGRSFGEIAAMLGRAAGAVRSKYKNLKLIAGDWIVPNVEIRVPQYSDWRAEFFGDPRPGRSALDARNGNVDARG